MMAQHVVSGKSVSFFANKKSADATNGKIVVNRARVYEVPTIKICVVPFLYSVFGYENVSPALARTAHLPPTS